MAVSLVGMVFPFMWHGEWRATEVNGKKSVVIVNKDGSLEQFGERYSLTRTHACGRPTVCEIDSSANTARWPTRTIGEKPQPGKVDHRD